MTNDMKYLNDGFFAQVRPKAEPRTLEVRPYNTVTVSYSENRKDKAVDMETGSGFKVLTNKALKKASAEYPLSRYEHEPNSTIIGRQLKDDGTAVAIITFNVREKERLEKSFVVETKASDLDEVDVKLSSFYSFGDVDYEEYLKALSIAKASATFKAFKSGNPDGDLKLMGIVDSFTSSSRVTLEIKYSELP